MRNEAEPMAVVGTRRTMKELVDGTIRVQIDIDPQHRTDFLQQFGEIDIAVGLVRLNLDSGQIEHPKPKEEKPFGSEASRLYACGFFFAPEVMAAVGTDAEYLEWLITQHCCAVPSMQSPPEWHRHDGDVVAAHVRRVAAGAGTGIKPEYSAVPLCSHHHRLQHDCGESAVGGKSWFDRQRAAHLSRWMAWNVFQVDSMGFVDPMKLYQWARDHDLTIYLPDIYR